jgi:hypothetical protein
MIKSWRNELFKPHSQKELTPNPLGFPMSQSQGQRIVGVCCRTWNRWEQVALLQIPEYKLTQIQLKGLAKQRGIPDQAIPIVPYQVWVIGKIGEYFGLLKNGTRKVWIVEENVKRYLDGFTREAYLNEQERFTKKIIEDNLCSHFPN